MVKKNNNIYYPPDYFVVNRNRKKYKSSTTGLVGDFTPGFRGMTSTFRNYPQDKMESDWGGTVGSSLMVIGTFVAAIAVITYVFGHSMGEQIPEGSNIL